MRVSISPSRLVAFESSATMVEKQKVRGRMREGRKLKEVPYTIPSFSNCRSVGHVQRNRRETGERGKGGSQHQKGKKGGGKDRRETDTHWILFFDFLPFYLRRGGEKKKEKKGKGRAAKEAGAFFGVL